MSSFKDWKPKDQISIAKSISRKDESSVVGTAQFLDNRPEAVQMRKLQKLAKKKEMDRGSASSGFGSNVQRVQHLWMLNPTGGQEFDEQIEQSRLQQEIRSSEYWAQQRKDSELEAVIRQIVEQEEWDSKALIERVGKTDYQSVAKAWEKIGRSYAGGSEQEKNFNKLTLVRLKHTIEKPDEEVSWPQPRGLSQSGYKYGTEREGTGKLDFTRKKDADSDQAIAVLKKYKRVPLVENTDWKLSTDNIGGVFDKVKAAQRAEVTLELTSSLRPAETKPEDVTGDIFDVYDDHTVAQDPPKIKVSDKKIEITDGISTGGGLDKFHEFFTVNSVKVPAKREKIQHVTVSGQAEENLQMARELLGATKQRYLKGNGPTTSKKYLNGAPKTSLEFLRSDDMNKEEREELERIIVEMKDIIKSVTKTEQVKFADDHLSTIIIPRTGCPVDLGGYRLVTGMTNVYPVIHNEENNMKTIPREFRERKTNYVEAKTRLNTYYTTDMSTELSKKRKEKRTGF